ncbi:MAG: class I SAM-dependent methyltransferase [Bacillota bacterium]|nr:class I SAM-dependent methyltransferase [Bacillota bacterium]
MKDIILDQRLQAVVDLLGHGHTVVDVGCDHGYVANYLVENDLAEKVYASDVSEPSLRKNQRFAYLRGNEDRVISVLGDGLRPLKGKDFDTVIIAGMGGDLIIKILQDSFDQIKDKTLILQPMTQRSGLRKYLVANGFKIQRETIVRDKNKFYEIFKAVPGEDLGSSCDYAFGQNLIEEKDPVLKEYLLFLLKKNQNYIKKAAMSKTAKGQERRQYLENEIELYKELLNDY